MLNTRFRFAPRGTLAFVSVVAGIALAVVVSGPASAVVPSPTDPPTTQAAAQDAYDTQTSLGSPSTPAVSSGLGTHFVTPAALTGKRQTFTRGSALAWSSDTFEWYWSGNTMKSSTGTQASGYVAPNVVSLKGLKRTLATSSEHLWQGAAAVGAEVPTPWSPVVIYQTTITDYFTLTANKLTRSSN